MKDEELLIFGFLAAHATVAATRRYIENILLRLCFHLRPCLLCLRAAAAKQGRQAGLRETKTA